MRETVDGQTLLVRVSPIASTDALYLRACGFGDTVMDPQVWWPLSSAAWTENQRAEG